MASYGGETPVGLFNARVGTIGGGISSYTVPADQYAKIIIIPNSTGSASVSVNSLVTNTVAALSLVELIFHSGDVIGFTGSGGDYGFIYVTLFNNPV